MGTLLEVIGSAVLEGILLAVATLAVLRAWKLGSIFENKRSYFQARGGRLGELLGCPLCLSYHVAFWLYVLFVLPVAILTSAWLSLILAPVVIFTAAGAAQSEWYRLHRDVQ